MNEFCLISWDYDDTLAGESPGAWDGYNVYAIEPFLQTVKEYHALGCKCIILTARSPSDLNKWEIDQFLKKYDIKHCISDIVYTSHTPKGSYAFELGVNLHYDDSLEHLESVKSYGIAVVCSVPVAREK